MRELRGRVAVVTGAASGIGFAMSRRFAAEGMRLVLADVEEAALAKAARALESEGAELLARPTDVSSAAQVEALAGFAFERFGAAHVIANNAGVVCAGPAHELAQQDWDWVLRVNLWGVIHGVRAFAPRLMEQGEGHLLATASIAGLAAVPGLGAYNVSKFGVVALMETLHHELAEAGSQVGVSVLCPGNVLTRITEADRNRPDALRPPGGPTHAELTFRSEAGRALAEEGMPPDAVAELVVDAIRQRRFWILTHPEWKDFMLRRASLLAESGQLPPAEG